MKHPTQGWINGLIGVIIFSASLPATRVAVLEIAPLFLTAARFGGAAAGAAAEEATDAQQRDQVQRIWDENIRLLSQDRVNDWERTKAGAALRAWREGAGKEQAALARELGSRGITVNCVAPGFIATDMTAALPDEQQKALLGQIPLGHLGQPDDIAHAVAYLASPRAGYITGQELHVNGGMFMA